MEILIIFGLMCLNGLFAMSEIALVSARKARLQKLIEEGDKSAAAAIELGENPTKFMSTIQIGITSIGILNGVFGEAVLAEPFGKWLMAMFAFSEKTSAVMATTIVVVAVTYFSIVVGELVPKRIGQSNPEFFARLVARPLILLGKVTKPFVLVLSMSTQYALRLLGIKEQAQQVTEDEIQAVLEEGTQAGVIEAHEHTMVRNVFRLDDRMIATFMVPRQDVSWIDLERTTKENMARIDLTQHPYYPVVRGDLHHVEGVLTARKWLALVVQHQENATEHMSQAMQKPLFVPETITGMELLRQFRTSDMHMAFVIDEFGDVLGIITLKDLVEAITGEFKPRTPEQSFAVARDDGSWILDGHIPIVDLKDVLDLRETPNEDKGQYHTLSGMLMLMMGRLPREADKISYEGWTFEIMDMDGRSIDKVLASRDRSTDDTTG